MPKTKGKSCPKEQRDFWTQKDGFYSTSVVFLCFCAADPFPAKRKREARQNLKNLKKTNTSEKRRSSSKSLSAKRQSNTRARIKQQQQEQQRRGGRSFENERKRARTIILVFFRRGGGKREDGFVVYFFVRFYDENHVDARKSPKSSREI